MPSSLLFPGNCRKLLDSGNITEHGGEMFCASCYRKNFGPKGYGFGGGSGCLSMDDGKNYTVSFVVVATTFLSILICFSFLIIPRSTNNRNDFFSNFSTKFSFGDEKYLFVPYFFCSRVYF